MSAVGDMTSVGTGGWWTNSSGDTTPPSPAPAAYVSAQAATSFAVTVTSVSGESSTTLRLQTRALGGVATWTTQASDATPAVGDVLTASGLTTNVPLEWRIVEEDSAGNQADGTHGVTTPSASIWATLTATVSTALQGQGLDAAAIYVGWQAEPNEANPCAILRTRPERVRDRANNVEQVEFPVRVEIRAAATTDTGEPLKEAGDLWQRRLESALHEKHATDFPGIAGLEEVTVEIDDKDDHGELDTFEAVIRTRATVRFLIWRAK